jgi:hypothetical protein
MIRRAKPAWKPALHEPMICWFNMSSLDGLVRRSVKMSKDEFHAFLRQFLQHQPFIPFTVELRDGRRLVVKQPPVVFSDGAASYIDPADGALVDFCHEEVQNFGVPEEEALA